MPNLIFVRFLLCLLLLLSFGCMRVDSTVEVKKPVIGISSSIDAAKQGDEAGRMRTPMAYVNAIIAAGGLPFVLPPIADQSILEEQLRLIDGVLIIGGIDVAPARYNETPHELLGEVNPDQDAFDFALVKAAFARHLPLLGVCRGEQVINVAFGGTLWQDISLDGKDVALHRTSLPGKDVAHQVTLQGWLAQVMGTQALGVNSFHHQAVRTLAKDFSVVAMSADGVIEGIHYDGPTFILGVQWHPELMYEEHPEMLTVYRELVAAAKRRAGK